MSEIVYVLFDSAEAFKSWHSSKCQNLGIPRPGVNANSGVVNVNAQWTTAWVEPVYVKGGVAVPMTEEERKADGLMGLPTVEPIVLEDGSQKIDPVEFEWKQDVPTTYEVEGKTVEVDRTKADPTNEKYSAPTTKTPTTKVTK